jgi:beta-lactamase class A
MDVARRRLFLAGLGSGICAALGACGTPERRAAPGPARLDQARLTNGFTALAARARPGVLGLGVGLIGADDAWFSDATARFPLQSVVKMFSAAALLSEVDAGRLQLAQPIALTAQDLSPGGAIDQAWPTPPEGHVMTVPVVDLIALALQRSDNTAGDAVMKLAGGPAAVTAWLRAKGLVNIDVDRTERDLQVELAAMPPFQPAWKDPARWEAARDAVPAETREAASVRYLSDPRDTATVPATLALLNRLALGDLLSADSTRLILRLMTDSRTGRDRLDAGLPPGTRLAHKTGTAATDVGLTPATNDVGIATLADGRRFAIAAFIAGSTATAAARDHLIADGARLAASSIV